MSSGTDAVSSGRQPVLDGVRAMSIVFVLCTHLLPLKLLWSGANDSAGMLGMALFFVLSGYLIGGQLVRRIDPATFVVHRLARVLPLAWLCGLIVGVMLSFEPSRLLAHLLFYANLPPKQLMFPLDHYWSLCVELQFYALAALLLCLRPAMTMIVVPALLLGVICVRIFTGMSAGSLSWVRGDDILAGAVLALVVGSTARHRVTDFLAQSWVLWLSGVLMLASCLMFQQGNPFNYVRSFAAATFVGALMSQPQAWLSRWLAHRRWAYLAAVSYAVYVLHLPLSVTWLGTGDAFEKYMKRPLLLIVVFGLAHLSTFYFERRFTQWARRFRRPREAAAF